MADLPATAGALMIDAEGRVLLGLRASWKRAYPDHWDIVGGHVEPGENPEQTVIREVEEEVGVRPTRVRLLDSLPEPRPDLYGPSVHHVFAIDAWEGGEPRNISDEHTEIRWFSIGEAAALPNLASAEYLRLIQLAAAARDG